MNERNQKENIKIKKNLYINHKNEYTLNLIQKIKLQYTRNHNLKYNKFIL